MKNQKGFSLVELLVVVIIIVIIAAIAIPSLLASRRAANEAAAISNLRTIHSAEITYVSTTTPRAYTNLAGLAAANIDLIDDVLGAGTKSGYSYVATPGTVATAGYCATAVPTTSLVTGTREFAVATDGVVYEFGAGAGLAGCADPFVSVTGGTAIQ